MKLFEAIDCMKGNFTCDIEGKTHNCKLLKIDLEVNRVYVRLENSITQIKSVEIESSSFDNGMYHDVEVEVKNVWLSIKPNDNKQSS